MKIASPLACESGSQSANTATCVLLSRAEENSDAMILTIAHREGDTAILGTIREVQAELTRPIP